MLRFRRRDLQDSPVKRSRQIDDLVADGDAAAKRLGTSRASEHAEGKILERKVALRLVCRWQPAADARIVSLIQHVVDRTAWSAPASNAHSPAAAAEIAARRAWV